MRAILFLEGSPTPHLTASCPLALLGGVLYLNDNMLTCIELFFSEEIVYSKDLHSVEKLQLDAVTGNIYWVDMGKVRYDFFNQYITSCRPFILLCFNLFSSVNDTHCC